MQLPHESSQTHPSAHQPSAARMVAQGVVTSRWTTVPACCTELPLEILNVCRLHMIHFLGPRVHCPATRSASCTALRRSLLVDQRVEYKLAVTAYKTRSTGVPSYLSTLIEDSLPDVPAYLATVIENNEMSRSLRSSLLCAPCFGFVCSKTAAGATPMVWHSSFQLYISSYVIVLFQTDLKKRVYSLLHTYRLFSLRHPAPLIYL